MPSVLSSGPNAVLKFGTVTAPASDWKLSLDAHLVDAANFADGRHQVGTLPDADFTTTMFYDISNQPHDPAGFDLVPGAAITAKCYTDVAGAHFFLVPIIISKIDVESKIEGIVMWNISAKQNGPIVYPTLP